MSLRVVDNSQPHTPHKRNPGFPLDLDWVERVRMNRYEIGVGKIDLVRQRRLTTLAVLVDGLAIGIVQDQRDLLGRLVATTQDSVLMSPVKGKQEDAVFAFRQRHRGQRSKRPTALVAFPNLTADTSFRRALIARSDRLCTYRGEHHSGA